MLNITRKPIKANRTKCNTPFIYCVLLRTAQTANDANTKGNSNGKCKSIRNPIQITSLYVIASHKQSTCRKWETTNIEARVLQCDWPQVVPSDWRTQWDFAYLLLAMLARHNLSWENRQWQRHGNLFWTLHVIFTFEHLRQPKIVARAQCTMTMLLPYDTWFRSFIKFVCFAFLRDAAAYAQNTCYWAHCVCVCVALIILIQVNWRLYSYVIWVCIVCDGIESMQYATCNQKATADRQDILLGHGESHLK